MLVDLHVHEGRFSKDSDLKLEEVVALARRRGLGGLAITDHDSMGLRDFARDYAARENFPIFVGVEYYSLWGDIIAFGVDRFPAERVAAQDFLDDVHAAGGFSIACHPFRSNMRGLAEHLDEVRKLDCVEVLNGSTEPHENLRAFEFAERLELEMSGASDAHRPEKLGVYATELEGEPRTEEEFLRILRAKALHPMAWVKGRYLEVSRANLMQLAGEPCDERVIFD